MSTDLDPLHLLWLHGPTEAETEWSRKLQDLVQRAGERPWSRDDERLAAHYHDKLDAASKDGDVVRSHTHAKTKLGEVAELLED